MPELLGFGEDLGCDPLAALTQRTLRLYLQQQAQPHLSIEARII